MMRARAAALAALAVLAAAASACSSAPPAATAGGAPAKRLVLVEAKGPGPELDRFVPHFLSAASDRGLGAIVDARLTGAHLADVGASGEASAAFRKEYPGDVYLGVMLAPCRINRHEGHIYDRQISPAGQPQRIDNVVVSYDADCTVAVTVVGEAGSAVKTFDVSGRNGTAEVSASDTEAEGQAAEDAADRAAKKLVSFLR
ncbi:MAG TPA: hypothetical protein VMV60_11020 [Thermoanaerobaculia bacterium]|nr:hypothetical protein [Thermoanaerobaculia bacterium]